MNNIPDFTLLKQSRINDCGITCWKMLLANKYKHIRFEEYLNNYAIKNQKGLNLLEMKNIGKYFNLESFWVKVVSGYDIEKLQTPSIINVDGKHFLILLCSFKEKIIVANPFNGSIEERVVRLDETHFYALQFY